MRKIIARNGQRSASSRTASNGAESPKPRAFTANSLHFGLITADALAGLKTLPDSAFNVAITSPPYYWVRDYGIDGQVGHEQSVEEYVSRLGDIFDGVKRVLHPKGVLYLNLGDTYYSGNGQPHGTDPRCGSRNFMRKKLRPVDKSGWDIPKKSLIGIPWKVAFELQKRGWTLRSDIIWRRQNAFAEPSARDRPKRQHEHIFLFSKSRFYEFDAGYLKEEGDVWSIDIERSPVVDHNAAFPRELVRRCMKTASPEGGRVLDPFIGSGTTIFTALELGRHCVGIDLKSEYTDGIVRSLETRQCKESDWEVLQALLKTDDESQRDWHNPKDLV